MITVIGGGTMGAGIVVSHLVVGESVRLVETTAEYAEQGLGRVHDSLGRLARKDESIDVDETLRRLEIGTDHGDAQASVVIEAVPEILALKREIFADLDERYPADAILASNTSSLSISAVAEGLTHPERVIGLHFFNPVPLSALVEIVVGERTDDATVDACRSRTEALGKTPIIVNDSPGFASSRLGLVLGLEAIRMLEDGVASAEDIDRAMELGYKHPMGPLRLTDLVGLDVRLAIAEHLASELGPRFEPPELLRQLVADGHLGKKTGQGFHTW